jgi:hypothetical protein
MIRRIVGKVSNDNPEEGLINLLAKMTGLNPSEIQLDSEISANIKQMSFEVEIKRIISPFYDDLKSLNSKESNKKIEELVDLGKFIYYLNLKGGIEREFEIEECIEKPDFIIKYQGEMIGLEITGLYDDNIVAEINALKRIIGKCQNKLKNDRSDITGLFNIIVIPSKLKGQLPHKENEIIEIICNYIISTYQNKEIDKPDFISDSIQSPHSILELTLGEDYWLAELTPEAIANSILKKENKIDNYKSSNNLNKCWLLIVIDGASSVSSFNIKLETLPIHLTPFDRIYIFDKLKRTIIKGEKTDGQYLG